MNAMVPPRPPEGLSILKKMSKLSEGMGFIEFDKKNTGQGYKYASAAAVIRKLQTLCVEHGVVFRCIEESVKTYPGPDHKSNLCETHATYRFSCVDSGEYIDVEATGSGKDSGDKAAMKASTACVKYAIAHALCLGWGAEDPEDDSKGSKATAKLQPLSASAVQKLITAAKSQEVLEQHRQKVVALKGEKGYDDVVAAYKQRKEELK